MKKLALSTPSSELVDAYLFEIAKGYGVSWSPPTPAVKEGGNDAELKEAEGDAKVCSGFARTLSVFQSTLTHSTPGRGEKGKRRFGRREGKGGSGCEGAQAARYPPD